MRPIVFASRTLLLAVLLQLVTACSVVDRVFPDRSKDYKKARPTSIRVEVATHSEILPLLLSRSHTRWTSTRATQTAAFMS